MQHISYTRRLFLTHNELHHLFVPFMHLLIIPGLGRRERRENELETEKEKIGKKKNYKIKKKRERRKETPHLRMKLP